MTVPVQHIAITLENGELYVMAFITNERLATPDNVNAEIAKASGGWVSPAANWRYVALDEIPTDRKYRAAWTDTGAGISHDMGKARGICLARLRAQRNEKLAELDKDWMRASGQKSGDAELIEAKRQELRDFPQDVADTLNAAKDIEALKAIQLPE